MPFPAQAAFIAVFSKNLSKGTVLIQIADGIVAAELIFGPGIIPRRVCSRKGHLQLFSKRPSAVQMPLGQPVMDAMLRWILPCHDGSPGRRADGRRAKTVVKANTASRKAVQMRRFYLRISGAAHCPGTIVISQNKQNIFLFRHQVPLQSSRAFVLYTNKAVHPGSYHHLIKSVT